MDEHVHQLLLSADDPVNVYPKSFDSESAVEKLRLLQRKLEHVTGRPFVLDDSIQDATYYATLSVVKQESNPFPHTASVFFLSFSCFGNLVTSGRTSRTESLAPDVVTKIIEQVRSEGYIHVDSQALSAPYDGENSAFVGLNWFQRFFDYL